MPGRARSMDVSVATVSRLEDRLGGADLATAIPIALAKPIPVVPPVTTAIFPASLCAMTSLLIGEINLWPEASFQNRGF